MYDRAADLLEALDRLLETGPYGPHAVLASLIAARLEDLDARNHPLPDASPREVLAFLMRQHGLRQDDLPDVADQGTISKVLAGKRRVSRRMADALARRFNVNRTVFL